MMLMLEITMSVLGFLIFIELGAVHLQLKRMADLYEQHAREESNERRRKRAAERSDWH